LIEEREREALEREKILKDALEKMTLAKEKVEKEIELERNKEGNFHFQIFFFERNEYVLKIEKLTEKINKLNK